VLSVLFREICIAVTNSDAKNGETDVLLGPIDSAVCDGYASMGQYRTVVFNRLIIGIVDNSRSEACPPSGDRSHASSMNMPSRSKR
jgi:uncharacterized protein (DUF779 family)